MVNKTPSYILLLDTEGTALVESSAAPLDAQPHMIEMSVVRLVDDAKLTEVERLTFRVKPKMPVPEEVTKITGITNELLSKEKGFAAYYTMLCDFALGVKTIMAHNLPYDMAVLAAELSRIDRLLKFPWPPAWLCVVEQTQYLTGKYLRLTELHVHLFGGEPPQQEHRAESDVDLLLKCVRRLRKNGVL